MIFSKIICIDFLQNSFRSKTRNDFYSMMKNELFDYCMCSHRKEKSLIFSKKKSHQERWCMKNYDMFFICNPALL